MDEANRLCDVCGGIRATLCCLCGGKETFLCDSCLSPHFAKNPSNLHQSIPASIYGQSTVPSSFHKVQARTSRLALLKKEGPMSIGKIDTCIAEFNMKIENMIQTLREFAQTTVTKVQQVKEDLERDLKTSQTEVEDTLYSENPSLSTKLGKQMRTFLEDPGSEMELFNYQIDQSSFPTSLKDILHFNLNIGEIDQLVKITGNSFQVYDLQGKKKKTGTLSVTFSAETKYCLVNNNALLCVDGNSTKMHSLNLSTYQIRELAAMNGIRRGFGLVKHKQFLYLFGGKDGMFYVLQIWLKTCLKYSLLSNEWTPLLDMKICRGDFVPCYFEEEIYLANTNNSFSSSFIEVFNIASEKFKTLWLILPLGKGVSASFIRDGDLIIFDGNMEVLRWRIHSIATAFKKSRAVTDDQECLFAEDFHLQVGRNVYRFSRNSKNVIGFNLDSLELHKTPISAK